MSFSSNPLNSDDVDLFYNELSDHIQNGNVDNLGDLFCNELSDHIQNGNVDNLGMMNNEFGQLIHMDLSDLSIDNVLSDSANNTAPFNIESQLTLTENDSRVQALSEANKIVQNNFSERKLSEEK